MTELEKPNCRGSIYLHGYTYQLVLRFCQGRQQTSEVPHNHPQYELHGVFRGGITLEQEGFPAIHMGPGECCVIPPYVYHLRRLATAETQCCTLYIDAPKGAPLQMESFCATPLKCAPVLMGYLDALQRELRLRQTDYESSVQSLLNLLLITIIREVAALPQTCTVTGTPTVSQQREEAIDNYFASHYGQNIQAKDLSDYLGITPRHLARVMQKRYGCTFRQHLLEIRLYHARQQLTNTETPIWQIANDCGFSCQGAFATAFRKYTGCTPSQYRTGKCL